ncbi:MAG TPA: carbohydrate kinase family protein [Candidatus Paceibacterota bacterium]|nr:carbohydrate kinase family protein [Candidatus Paceibacterota bacterium]
MFSKHIDFLAIGDIVVDAFIQLKEAHLTCDVDHADCEICMKFGDKIPYQSLTVIPAVGNSANAAVAAARLGLSSSLVADVGGDQNGKECLDTLKKNGVDGRHVSRHRGMETNYHYVLWYGAERTILVKHQEYPYKLPRMKAPDWVYISSLGGNSYEYHLAIIEWLKENPQVKVAFQPGTFQMSLGLEKLGELYRRSDVFFCNKEEAQRILGSSETDAKKLMAMLRGTGPRTVVVTDGPAGAYADDGMNAYYMPPYPDPKPAYERTGAGDAFSSTFTVALALGKSVEEALLWAPINSASVVQDVGAQRGLLTRAELEEWLAKAPADYKPRKI